MLKVENLIPPKTKITKQQEESQSQNGIEQKQLKVVNNPPKTQFEFREKKAQSEVPFSIDSIVQEPLPPINLTHLSLAL